MTINELVLGSLGESSKTNFYLLASNLLNGAPFCAAFWASKRVAKNPIDK